MAKSGILNIRLLGDSEVIKRLNTMDVEKKADKALRWGAQQIEKKAKGIVRVRDGFLKNSINHYKKGRLEYAIGSGKEYAAAQEFGRPDMKGYSYRPYLRPAARIVRPLMNKKFVQLLGEK